MTLRVTRGLFRLWLVGSVVFVLAVVGLSYGEIEELIDPWPGEVVVPKLCGDARGIAGLDYSTKLGQQPGPWDEYSKPNPFDNCWYALSKFRTLYPEYGRQSDEELSAELYTAAGIQYRQRPSPWIALARRVEIALGVPLVVLTLGVALIWAAKGFADEQ
jgi:hypothetical protein